SPHVFLRPSVPSGATVPLVLLRQVYFHAEGMPCCVTLGRCGLFVSLNSWAFRTQQARTKRQGAIRIAAGLLFAPVVASGDPRKGRRRLGGQPRRALGACDRLQEALGLRRSILFQRFNGPQFLEKLGRDRAFQVEEETLNAALCLGTRSSGER